jgi:hypothetical protein
MSRLSEQLMVPFDAMQTDVLTKNSPQTGHKTDL